MCDKQRVTHAMLRILYMKLLHILTTLQFIQSEERELENGSTKEYFQLQGQPVQLSAPTRLAAFWHS